MTFTDHERQILLATKGVGPKVIQRLEELGVGSFAVSYTHLRAHET